MLLTEDLSLLFFVSVPTLRPALNRSAGVVKLDEKAVGATGLGDCLEEFGF